MRQVFVCRVAVKSELQHLHAGVFERLDHSAHAGRDKAQVLGDDPKLAQLLLCRKEERFVRSLAPSALFGGFVAEGDCIVALKATEMVDADDIIEGCGEFQTLDPPFVFGFLVVFPIIEGISPQLPRRGERIGRAACHFDGAFVFVQCEKLRRYPHIRTVHCNINWDISNDIYSVIVSILL